MSFVAGYGSTKGMRSARQSKWQGANSNRCQTPVRASDGIVTASPWIAALRPNCRAGSCRFPSIRKVADLPWHMECFGSVGRTGRLRRYHLTSATSRRDFLVAATAAASVPSAFGYPANETINIGCIGTGGRCRVLMRSLSRVPGTRIGAVCDIWDDALEQSKEIALRQGKPWQGGCE